MDSPDSSDWWDVLDVSVGGGPASSSACTAVDDAAATALGLNPSTATSGGGSGGASFVEESMCPASAEPRPAGLVAPTAVKREEGVGLSLASPMEGSGVAALGSGGGAEQEKVEATCGR